MSSENSNFLNKLNGFKLADGYFRSKSRGGSCILVDRNLDCCKRNDLACLNEELIFEGSFIEIKSIKCIFISLYTVPGYSMSKLFLDKFRFLLQTLEKEIRFKKVVIASDFNINLLKKDKSSEYFQTVVNEFGFVINNRDPTRITNTTVSCIDNILTSVNFGKGQLCNINTSFSDHNALLLSLPNKLNRQFCTKRIKIRMYPEENNILFVNRLKLMLSDMPPLISLDDCYNFFLENFIFCMNEFFPIKNIKVKNKKSNKWITQGIKISAAKKRQLHWQAKYNLSIEFQQYVKNYKKVFKSVVKAAKIASNDNYIFESKNKSRATWAVVKREMGTHCNKISEPITLKINNKIISNPQKVTKSFNNHFINTVDLLKVPKADLSFVKDSPSCKTKYLSEFSPVSVEEVAKIILGLNNTKSCGWDDIPVHLLKLSVQVISPILTYIFNLAIRTCTFPTKLKLSEIKPIFKKGIKNDIQNFRPISLLSNISKIFEKALHNRIVYFLESNNLLGAEQFGFRKNRSTELALINFVSDAARALDGSQFTAGIFCDLSRAFDCVDHEMLIKKMASIGIEESALKLLTSYLLGRKQRTVITDRATRFYSDWATVKFGVPQGSILGPTLFLIYINDLPAHISKRFVLFADDTSVIVQEKNLSALENTLKLTLKDLKKWFESNGLLLNESKSNIMQFHIRINNNHKLNGTDFNITDKYKFLGINIDQSFNWKSHIQYLVSKLTSFRFAIKCIQNSVSLATLKIIYYAYIHSLLRYGIVLWGNSGDISKVFKVQKSIIRVMIGAEYGSSCRRSFKELKIMPLTSLYIYETVNFVHLNNTLFDEFRPTHSYNTRNPNLLNYPIHKHSHFEKNPIYMGICLYNKIPSKIKSYTPQKFKIWTKSLLVEKSYYFLVDFLNDRDID